MIAESRPPPSGSESWIPSALSSTPMALPVSPFLVRAAPRTLYVWTTGGLLSPRAERRMFKAVSALAMQES
jgi:hypothetical protein